MQFRTKIDRLSLPFQISHEDALLFCGSCFSEHIFNKFDHLKFSAKLNSHGILYHPLSITKSLDDIVNGKIYQEDDLIFSNGLWQSFNHHGYFSNPDLTTCLDTINQSIQVFKSHLQGTNFIVCTLGTSLAFKLKSDSSFVANCHKFPADNFNRVFIQSKTISAAFNQSIQDLKAINPGLKFLFAVSPVRHIRDGLIENQKSKASLLLSVHEIVKQNKNAFYFPSYEIMMDDLRDYRFYQRDLIHPNEQGIDYIWDIFQDAVFTNQTQALNKRIAKINAALAHKPFFPKSEKHQIFLKQQLEKIELLEAENQLLDFSIEKENIKLIYQP